MVKEYDEITVLQVLRDGHRMKLRGADRIEAMRRMSKSGEWSAQRAADALMIKRNNLTMLASRLKLKFEASREPMHWSVSYANPSASSTNKRRREREKQQSQRFAQK